MTGQTLYNTHLSPILDGEKIDTDLALSLFNLAKNRREAERPWRFLLKEDSSQSASSTDLYTTMKTLPTDFGVVAEDIDGAPVIYVGTSFAQFYQIPYESRHVSKDMSFRYYIDHGAGQFGLTGGATGTIYLPYLMVTTDLTALSDDFSSRWPNRFLPLIAYDAAAMYRGGTDFDDNNARMKEENRTAARLLYDGMIQWDTRLKMQVRKGRDQEVVVDLRAGRTYYSPTWPR